MLTVIIHTEQENNQMSEPGTIYLENCLAHCNIANSIACHFTGSLNLHLFSTSVSKVLSATNKFRYELIPLDNGEGAWKEKGRNVPPVKLIRCKDIDESLKDFSCNIFSLCREYGFYPVFFTVFAADENEKMDADELRNDDNKDNISVKGKFCIVQTLNHAYCDGRSCEFLLNQITEYYNALLENDLTSMEKILKRVSLTSTPSSDEIYSFGVKNSVIKLSRWQHIKNIFRLVGTKLNDDGEFSVSYPVIEAEWEKFRTEKHRPQMHFFDLNPIISHYAGNKNVNTNSIITALLVKAFRHVNAVTHNHPEKKKISFRMMSDILSAKQRQQFIGNYCAYVPVVADGSLPLENVASDILKQVDSFRNNKVDVSMYKFLEFALRKHMAGKKDDPVSFTVSLILHRKFIRHPNSLKGATFIKTTGTLNYEPLDLFGAKLNNKIAPTISLSSDNVLFVTYYPLIGGDEILNKVTDALKTVIENEISVVNKEKQKI